jgi:hypothetical protein
MNNDTKDLRDNKGQTKPAPQGTPREAVGKQPTQQERQDQQGAGDQSEKYGEAKPGTPDVRGE